MNQRYIIDSSAFIMAMYKENPQIEINQYLSNGIMHHINVSEVLAVLRRDGITGEIARKVINSAILSTVATDIEQADLAANIRMDYKGLGISTGDSFCLSAAKQLKYPVVTADKIWTQIDIGVEIICVR